MKSIRMFVVVNVSEAAEGKLRASLVAESPRLYFEVADILPEEDSGDRSSWSKVGAAKNHIGDFVMMLLGSHTIHGSRARFRPAIDTMQNLLNGIGPVPMMESSMSVTNTGSSNCKRHSQTSLLRTDVRDVKKVLVIARVDV
jgi:hypothetical protein